MAIKPLDLQVMIPKVNEVSRIRTDEQQRELAIQQNAVEASARESENNLRQVNSREQTHEAAIRERNEKGKRQSKEKDRKKQQGEPGNNASKTGKETYSSGSTIDIRL